MVTRVKDSRVGGEEVGEVGEVAKMLHQIVVPGISLAGIARAC
jgi:hypothetical protein